MINNRKINIGIIAGEISGDILGARLIKNFKKKNPNIHFIGIAGPLMKKEGCKALYGIEILSIIGIIEILKYLPKLILIRKNIIKQFIKNKIDIFIGIDSPDFNLNIEMQLKSKGIKTIHYISPSIWAWRKKRIIKIKKATDLILVFLPFEKKIYDEFNIPCCFIGHTMADKIPLIPNKQKTRLRLNIPEKAKCLAILPGSRYSEIKKLSNIFLKTAKILKKYFKDLYIIVPTANEKCRQQFELIKQKNFPDVFITILNGQSIDAMISADVTLLASGTASLECMLAKCPMVVCYKMNFFTFLFAKILIKTPYISLPNLLAKKEIIKEFLQKECQPNKLSNQLIQLLNNEKYCKILKKNFLKLHKTIRHNADEKAVNEILKLIKI
ncbi:lipid-A-disaccharide synthase [Candidatus Providencia siddallii]|uniref:Lipid-A-disaccharide synthase n=1 Tax=Candidatus Providencia siddallii TaxID=1715285 RepID=A0ABM9NNW3_9GAMM